jgi:hypothetical protein
VNGRPVRIEDALAKDGRCDATRELVARERNRLVRAAASTARTIAPSCAGDADTIIIPPSRSQTSSPRDSANARTPGTICSAASARCSAPASPSSFRSEASDAQ